MILNKGVNMKKLGCFFWFYVIIGIWLLISFLRLKYRI